MRHPRWTRAALEELADDLFADDVDLMDEHVQALQHMPKAKVEAFFLSGGILPPPPPPPPPPYTPPSISINATAEELANTIRAAGKHGLLQLTDLPTAPFANLQAVFDDLHAGHQTRPCYPPGFVLKEANASGVGGAVGADQKRILDLNPRRLEEAEDALLRDAWTWFQHGTERSCTGTAPAPPAPRHAALASTSRDGDDCSGSSRGDERIANKVMHDAFNEVVVFWRAVSERVAPALRAAVARAASCDDVLADGHFDYRMVDYYERTWCRTDDSCEDAGAAAQDASAGVTPPPRCRAHRDFGSFTLVFAQLPGLQALLAEPPVAAGALIWRDLAVSPPGAALLLFGWCTQIRSNGRLHAAQHRVIDGPEPLLLHRSQDAADASSAATEQDGPGGDATGSDVPDACNGTRSARRTSFVFFVSPNDMQAPLHPVVLEGESAEYFDGVSAEAQQMYCMNPLARAKLEAKRGAEAQRKSRGATSRPDETSAGAESEAVEVV